MEKEEGGGGRKGEGRMGKEEGGGGGKGKREGGGKGKEKMEERGRKREEGEKGGGGERGGCYIDNSCSLNFPCPDEHYSLTSIPYLVFSL